MTYLIVFITALILTLITTPLSAALGRRLQLTDRPGGRRAHQGEVPRLGGIALFAGFAGLDRYFSYNNNIFGNVRFYFF